MQDTIVIIAYNSPSPDENRLAHVGEDASDGSSESLVRCMTYESKPFRMARGYKEKMWRRYIYKHLRWGAPVQYNNRRGTITSQR
jgi:hypothetical protein